MLKKLMQEYIEKYTIERLEQETGVKNAILREILNSNPRRAKFRQTTLDALYEFFGLVADNFYFDNLKKWYPKTETLLGTFLRTKRIQMGYSHEKLASLINGNKLAIQRLEMWDSLPVFQSYTMQNIMYHLKLDSIERQFVKNFIQAVKDIEKLVKQQYNETIK